MSCLQRCCADWARARLSPPTSWSYMLLRVGMLASYPRRPARLTPSSPQPSQSLLVRKRDTSILPFKPHIPWGAASPWQMDRDTGQ